MKRIILLSLLILSGCISRQTIDDQLAKCPYHVRRNVGEIKYYPLSWGTVLFMSGVTDKNTGEIWLTGWADEHAILHEIAHSVYFRTPHAEFKKEFARKKGFISVWSVNIDEEIAEAFVEGMKGRSNEKIDCAMAFYKGEKWGKENIYLSRVFSDGKIEDWLADKLEVFFVHAKNVVTSIQATKQPISTK